MTTADDTKSMGETRLMEFTGKKAISLALMFLSLVFEAGCSDHVSPSSSYTTSSIYTYMKAVQDESGSVTTTVQLRDGPTTSAGYIYLANTDVLYSSIDIPPRQYLNFSSNLFSNSLELSQHLKVMAPRDIFIDFGVFTRILTGTPEYFATDTPIAGYSPTRAYVGFERSGNTMTGESSVELPPAFRILSPASDAVISRTTPITLTWSDVDPNSTMALDVAGSCLDNTRFTLHHDYPADTGSITLNSADYFSPTASPTTNCRIAFLLQRVRLGGVSPQFAFGTFTGIQQRTVQFTSTP